MKDPRALMDEWEQATPPMPKQFLQMLAQSGIVSPLQMKFIQALLKNPAAGAPTPPQGAPAPVSQPDAGVGTQESSALGPANPVPKGPGGL